MRVYDDRQRKSIRPEDEQLARLGGYLTQHDGG
jgi:hypothetical protein